MNVLSEKADGRRGGERPCPPGWHFAAKLENTPICLKMSRKATSLCRREVDPEGSPPMEKGMDGGGILAFLLDITLYPNYI
jgi:hypothetical protein